MISTSSIYVIKKDAKIVLQAARPTMDRILLSLSGYILLPALRHVVPLIDCANVRLMVVVLDF